MYARTPDGEPQRIRNIRHINYKRKQLFQPGPDPRLGPRRPNRQDQADSLPIYFSGQCLVRGPPAIATGPDRLSGAELPIPPFFAKHKAPTGKIKFGAPLLSQLKILYTNPGGKINAKFGADNPLINPALARDQKETSHFLLPAELLHPKLESLPEIPSYQRFG